MPEEVKVQKLLETLLDWRDSGRNSGAVGRLQKEALALLDGLPGSGRYAFLHRLRPQIARLTDNGAAIESIIAPVRRHLQHHRPWEEQRDAPFTNTRPLDVLIVLENIRSAFNTGSMIRSAEAFGLKGVVLAGYTPGPGHPQVQRASMGCEQRVCCHTHADIQGAMDSLRKEGRTIIGVEIAPHAKSLYSAHLPLPAALVFGNERFGLSERALESCDQVIAIPQFGTKNSLNVACAMAILACDYRRRYGDACDSNRVSEGVRAAPKEGD